MLFLIVRVDFFGYWILDVVYGKYEVVDLVLFFGFFGVVGWCFYEFCLGIWFVVVV